MNFKLYSGHVLLLLSFLVANTVFSQVSVFHLEDEHLEEFVIIKEVRAADSSFKYRNGSGLDGNLEQKNGIHLVRRSALGNEINLRGVSGNRLDISIDGMRMVDACTDKMGPVNTYLDPAILQAVQVNSSKEKGGLSMSNGERVEFNLRSPTTGLRSNSIEFTQGLQSVSKGYNSSLLFENNRNKFATINAIGITQHDNYLAGNGREVEFSQMNKFYYYHNSKFKPSERYWIQLKGLWSHAWDIGFPALPMDVSLDDAKLVGLDFHFIPKKSTWKHSSLYTYYSQIDHVMDDSKRPDVPIRMDMPGKSRTLGARLKNVFKLGGRDLRTEIEGLHTYQWADMVMYPPEEESMYMVTWPGVQMNRLSFSGNWRLFQSDKRKSNLYGSFGLLTIDLKDKFGKQQWSGFVEDKLLEQERNNFSIGYQSAYYLPKRSKLWFKLELKDRAPDASELFGFYLFNRNNGYDYLGNPDLANERRATGEVNWSITNKKLDLQFGSFASFYANYILGVEERLYDAMTIGAEGVRIYQNYDNALFIGAESRLRWSLSESITLQNQLDFVKATFISEGDDLPLIPPFRSYSSLVYKKQKSRLSLSANFNNRQNQVSTALYEQATPSSLIFNLQYQHSFENERFENLNATFGIDNLLDKSYHLHTSWNDLPSYGRNFYLKLFVKI